jgi:UDP-N-acetylmuramoyl-tripeptide--D-alanyl-D-alanine ligase
MILRDEDIALGTGGRLRQPGPPGVVTTDSRRLAPGQWFLALSGDRFDGHTFLAHAREAGCAGAIARQVPEGWDRGFVQVEDGLAAVQALAGWVRQGFHGPVVGVTGSAGKTTTRAMIALVLGQDEPGGPRVHATHGNLNNHIGLPLSILDAPVDADAWVLEMGMNHLGEIDLLQRIARPTVRLITNVGAAHLEGVGDLEGVARAKGELFAGARPGDLCVVNRDDPRISALPLPEGVSILRYGSAREESSQVPQTPEGGGPARSGSPGRAKPGGPTATSGPWGEPGGVPPWERAARDDWSIPLDVRLTDAHIDPETLSTRFRVETPGGGVVLGQIHSPGLHLAHDACAAIAVGVALRVPAERMAARLARYEPVGMRLRVESGPRGERFLNDAYNANPVSMAASLETLGSITGHRRLAMLGDMLELGSDEARAHDEVLERVLMALEAGELALVGLVGPRFAAAVQRRASGPDEGLLVEAEAEALGRRLAPLLQPDDVVLLKGSRGIAMERTLHTLRSLLTPSHP